MKKIASHLRGGQELEQEEQRKRENGIWSHRSRRLSQFTFPFGSTASAPSPAASAGDIPDEFSLVRSSLCAA